MIAECVTVPLARIKEQLRNLCEALPELALRNPADMACAEAEVRRLQALVRAGVDPAVTQTEAERNGWTS